MSIIALIRPLADRITRNASVNARCDISRPWLLMLVMATGFAITAQAQSYYFVDCSGTNPNDYSTIGAALAVAGPNSYVIVNGVCHENVTINNAWNLNLGAAYGQTAATINGNVTVVGSNSVFLYGLHVTNHSGDAIDITSSHNVTLWTFAANGSQDAGLVVEDLSDVAVEGPGSFDNNLGGGLTVAGNSAVTVYTWGGPLDINGNHGPGVSVETGSLFTTLGNTTIGNNINVPGGSRPDGFGIQALSASKVQIANCFGGNQISANQSGAIDIREHSQVAIWNCTTASENLIKDNGPVGIDVGTGSELALYTNVVISGHTGPGVELYAQGQLYMYGPNRISNNGSADDPRSAGVVVDGNSEAYLRGGTLSENQGPGILALVNSSVDSVGANFSGNTGGDVTCDSSAYLVSDLLSRHGNPPPGISCRTPHHLGNRQDHASAPVPPDFTAEMNKAAQYKKFASPK